MEVDRRTVLVGSAAFGAAAAIPLGLTYVTKSQPKLYGDGQHDDSLALQALCDGRAERVDFSDFVGVRFVAGERGVSLNDAILFLASPVVLKSGKGHYCQLNRCVVRSAPIGACVSDYPARIGITLLPNGDQILMDWARA